MNSQNLFQSELVSVTATMFTAGSTQIPIRNIAEINVVKQKPNRKVPLYLLGGGFFLGAFGASQLTLGLIGLGMMGLAVWLFFNQKPTYWIEVISSGKTSKPHKSSDLSEIQAIQSAINNAIALM